ncbi:MAG TPA: anthranilate synthase component I family protein [Gemmatimonadales bacterium]|nr:anthranilate synthase component I family protein [Gemmatimonadales bacterium]
MTTDFDSFRRTAAKGGMVPVAREVLLDGDTAVSAFAKVHHGPYGFLLESLEGGERWARYSFLATEPREVYRYKGKNVERWTAAQGNWKAIALDIPPLDHLAQTLRRFPAVEVPGFPRFTGGAVGFIGYDVVRTIEKLPKGAADDRALPDAVVMIVDTLLAVDNLHHRAQVIATVAVPAKHDDVVLRELYDQAQARIANWSERLTRTSRLGPLDLDAPNAGALPLSPYAPEAYRAGVKKIKEYIAAGDCFQTVLSRRLEVPAPDPLLAYRYLRALNPAPYLFCLHLDDIHIVGSSPEALVRVEDGEVTVRPIAGTRPRGATPKEDATFADELLADPKERAEHMMLLDLGRNDVGRVAKFGSVKVTQQMALERYSHVMHLVSEVRGTLREDLDALAALAAAFPAGTVSGAPKVRAMEIIDELEPSRRGPYAGAIGWFGWGAKSLDTAIAIRTAVIKGGRAWVQAGAGIVADSDPQKELEETEAKARGVLTALAHAARQRG